MTCCVLKTIIVGNAYMLLIMMTGLVRYYNPDWDNDDYFDTLRAANAYCNAEECKQSLEDAVIMRCMADVEVGLLLSGGLDSSIIGAIMTQPNVREKLTATHSK